MSAHDELFMRWELGQGDAADELALAEALRDPAARRAFARNARVAAALGTPLALAPARTATPSARTRSSRPRRMRHASAPLWLMAAGLLLACGLAALLLTGRPWRAAPEPEPTGGRQVATIPAAKAIAYLTTPEGARIRPSGGAWRKAWAGDALVPGDAVESGTGTAVIMVVANVARLDLAPRSTLELPVAASDPVTAALRLRLTSGSVEGEVATRQASAPFIIDSPVASAEVVGTHFTFGLDPDGARLAVDHGAVRLSTASDPGVLVGAGQAGLASDGLASLVPATADADQSLPAGARVLWRATPVTGAGWRGVAEGSAWRSVGPRPGDQWCNAELRSPQVRDGWTVAASTWLRFRYHVERFTPGLALEVHLKPADETNYAQRLVADHGVGWHQVLLRVDGEFRHLERKQPLAVGDRIHGAVWCVLRGQGSPASAVRFWIRDAVVFTAP